MTMPPCPPPPPLPSSPFLRPVGLERHRAPPASTASPDAHGAAAGGSVGSAGRAHRGSARAHRKAPSQPRRPLPIRAAERSGARGNGASAAPARRAPGGPKGLFGVSRAQQPAQAIVKGAALYSTLERVAQHDFGLLRPPCLDQQRRQWSCQLGLSGSSATARLAATRASSGRPRRCSSRLARNTEGRGGHSAAAPAPARAPRPRFGPPRRAA